MCGAYVQSNQSPSSIRMLRWPAAACTQALSWTFSPNSASLSPVAQLEASLMKFRNDLAIGGNISAQTSITPQTQVCGAGHHS